MQSIREYVATHMSSRCQLRSKLENIPCMQIVDFKNINDVLCLTAYFRSHDIWGAWPMNVYGLSELLRYVSESVNINTGNITMVSSSAHIYQRDWDSVLDYLYRNNGHLLNIWKGILRARVGHHSKDAIA